MLAAGDMAAALQKAIAALPKTQQAQARAALQQLQRFDGKLTSTSADGALYEAFLQESAKQIFLDELGPEKHTSLASTGGKCRHVYSAQADHLLGRVDSPFWDDITTPQKEDKPVIWRAVWQRRRGLLRRTIRAQSAELAVGQAAHLHLDQRRPPRWLRS